MFGSARLIASALTYVGSEKQNDDTRVEILKLVAPPRGTYNSWDPTAAVQAQFHYEGDGRRVQSVVNGVTTAFVGQYFEWTGSTSTMKKYYYFGAQRVAVRDGNGTGTSGLSWLLTDHLGSTTITLDAAGAKNAEKRYKPWGEERFTFGTLPTQYTYTGQISHTAQFGLMFYNARWFDPYLNRWVQPDTIIPQNQGVHLWIGTRMSTIILFGTTILPVMMCATRMATAMATRAGMQIKAITLVLLIHGKNDFVEIWRNNGQ